MRCPAKILSAKTFHAMTFLLVFEILSGALPGGGGETAGGQEHRVHLPFPPLDGSAP